MRLDLTIILIWTLRILLPILFFAIYFKLQAPKEKPVVVKDTRNVYSRLKLLQLRKAMKGAAAPDPIKNITFKDQTQAPELFTGSGRERRAERRRGEDETKAPKERKEKKEKKKDPSPETRTFTEERMHLESLLNYVAFQRPEQQRAFLPSHGVAAPPSPPKASTDEEEATDAAKAEAPKAVIVGAQAGKANDEAQMVLKGSMKMKRSDVARNLYDQLVESQVEVAESTYELLIDACVLADDLRGASDFMMKMEAAGFLPKTELMDKVMDLYTHHKKQEPADDVEEANEGIQESVVEQLAQPSVAMNYAMPDPMLMPMFNWDDFEDEDGPDPDEPPTKLNSDAPVFVPSFIPGPPPPQQEGAIASEAQGGTLSAAAMPFQPPHNMTYDPMAYAWASDAWAGPYAEPDEIMGKGGKSKDKAHGRGKGDGEGGKGKWKGKGEWQSGKPSWKGEDSHGKDRGESDSKPATGKKQQMSWKPKTDS